MYHNLRKNGTDEVRIERSRMRNMKVVDTREYVGMLKELTEEERKSACWSLEAVWHRF